MVFSGNRSDLGFTTPRTTPTPAIAPNHLPQDRLSFTESSSSCFSQSGSDSRWHAVALGLGSEGGASLVLFLLPVLPKLVSCHVNGKLTHPVVVFVAYWDHTPSGELTTHMGTRASGIPMSVICTINAVLWVSVLVPSFICPFESFDGLVNEGELDQASTHVIERGCLM